jgi:transposase
MSQTQGYEWFKRFKEGRMSVGEDPRPGQPSTLANDDHVERVRAVIHGNHYLTVREVADNWASA